MSSSAKYVNLAGTTGAGYYAAAANGTVRGSGTPAAGHRGTGRAVGLTTDPGTGGYWLLKADGGVVARGAQARSAPAGLGEIPQRETAVSRIPPGRPRA